MGWLLKLVPDFRPAVYICVSEFITCNNLWKNFFGLHLIKNAQNTIVRRSAIWLFKKDRIKKFDLKKKLKLTQGTYWTIFWRYHDQHSIGKPIEITTSRLRFVLVSQWSADHRISRMLSKNYLPLVVTFFLRSNFLIRSF